VDITHPESVYSTNFLPLGKKGEVKGGGKKKKKRKRLLFGDGYVERNGFTSRVTRMGGNKRSLELATVSKMGINNDKLVSRAAAKKPCFVRRKKQ